MYRSILDGIQEQIRFADMKAGFIAALNAVLFGFLSRHLDEVLVYYARSGTHTGALAFALSLHAVYLIAMAASVGAVLWSMMPRFGRGDSHSKVFFGHIARSYGRDYSRYVRDTASLSNLDWAEQLGAQIVETSHIALRKHQLVRRAGWFALVAFILWRVALLFTAFLPAGT